MAPDPHISSNISSVRHLFTASRMLWPCTLHTRSQILRVTQIPARYISPDPHMTLSLSTSSYIHTLSHVLKLTRILWVAKWTHFRNWGLISIIPQILVFCQIQKQPPYVSSAGVVSSERQISSAPYIYPKIREDSPILTNRQQPSCPQFGA